MLLTPIIDYCPRPVGGCKTRKKKISRPEGFTFFWGRGEQKKCRRFRSHPMGEAAPLFVVKTCS